MTYTATITINADNLTGCDFVQVNEILRSPMTFDLTAGTYVNGQIFTLLIFTTTQRGIPGSRGPASSPPKASSSRPLRAGGLCPVRVQLQRALQSLGVCGDKSGRPIMVSAGFVQTAGGQGSSRSGRPPQGALTGSIGTIHLPMSAVKFPPTNFAVYDASEVNGRLLFDGGAISECVWWGPFR